MKFFFFFSSRRRHTRFSRDWSSDVCSSDLDDRVVERRLDVRLTDSDVLAHAAPRATAGRLSTRRGHLGFRRCFLAAAEGLLRALARARVRLRPLAVDRQAAAVTDAAVRADLA